jgi:hypothetical protein
LPKNTRELRLGYEKIPVCRNGSMLLWKDNENVKNCKMC